MVFMVSHPWLFFLTTPTRISVSETRSTCAVKWQCPCAVWACSKPGCVFVSRCCPLPPARKFLFVMSSPRFSTCSALQRSCSPGWKLALRWGYLFNLGVLDEKSIPSLLWWLLASIWRVSSKYLKGFYFFLPQVLVVPMLGNIPYLAMVFHSCTSGVDSQDTSPSRASADPGWGGPRLTEGHRPERCATRSPDEALGTVSEQSFVLKFRCQKNPGIQNCVGDSNKIAFP